MDHGDRSKIIQEEISVVQQMYLRYHWITTSQTITTPKLKQHMEKTYEIIKLAKDMQEKGGRANMEDLKLIDSEVESHYQSVHKDTKTLSYLQSTVSIIRTVLVDMLYQEYLSNNGSEGYDREFWKRQGNSLSDKVSYIQKALDEALLNNKEWAEKKLCAYACDNDWKSEREGLIKGCLWSDLARKLILDRNELLQLLPKQLDPGAKYNSGTDMFQAQKVLHEIDSTVSKYFTKLRSTNDFELSSLAKKQQPCSCDAEHEDKNVLVNKNKLLGMVNSVLGKLTIQPAPGAGQSRPDDNPPEYKEKA